jgi:hypothetical protein
MNWTTDGVLLRLVTQDLTEKLSWSVRACMNCGNLIVSLTIAASSTLTGRRYGHIYTYTDRQSGCVRSEC